ncbi:MAG: NUDIX domain-containing protein [Acidobacteria bacterium]|nr:NUDIX domain-containing protein [Acidobacteriota bacterium]
MSKSKYIKKLREKVGHDLLLVPGVAAIIRDDDGKVLIQKNKQGKWNLPAGAIEPGEKPAQSIAREVFEETGLKVKPTAIVGVVGGAPEYRMTYDNGDSVESTTIVFHCDICGGELKPQDDETAVLKFVTVRDMPGLLTKLPKTMYSLKSTKPIFEWDETWIDELK